MRRRFVTWIALFAMLASIGAPAHAYAHLRAAGGIPADLCTSKSTTSVPAAPGAPHVDTCDACANCMPAGAPRARLAMPAIVSDCVRAAVPAAPAGAPPAAAYFAARAPPPPR